MQKIFEKIGCHGDDAVPYGLQGTKTLESSSNIEASDCKLKNNAD